MKLLSAVATLLVWLLLPCPHAQAQETLPSLVVMADSSKFILRGSLVVCSLSRISTLITDAQAPMEALDMLRNAGVDVMISTETPDEVAAA